PFFKSDCKGINYLSIVQDPSVFFSLKEYKVKMLKTLGVTGIVLPKWIAKIGAYFSCTNFFAKKINKLLI
ncbi:MAG: hypothetical protein AAGG75_27545, partial [Bacteroidota bacterium]